MPLFGNGIDSATREVRRLKEARVTLADRETKAREEIDQLRADLPAIALADVLDPPPGGLPPGAPSMPNHTTARNRMLSLEYDISSCVAATKALFPKLESALRNLNIARGAEIRKRADKLSLELSEHRQKVEKLAEQLWSLEGCQYVPNIFPQGHRGTGDGPVPFVATKSMLLTEERDKLLAQADAEENRPVNDGGSAEGSDLDTVLTAVASADLQSISPTPAQITAWYVDALAHAEAEWSGVGRRRGDPEPPWMELRGVERYRSLTVSLLWLKDGVIDAAHSAVKYSNRFEIPREVAAELGAVYPAIAAD